MSTLKLFTTAKLSKSLPAAAAAGGLTGGWSPRKFVTASTPLQCKKEDDHAAENVKEAAESVQKAADSISENANKMTEKVSETADVVKEKAKEMLSFGAVKIATEVIKKKQEMKEEANKNKK